MQDEASTRTSEDILERFDRYIVIQVQRLRRYYPAVIHSAVQDLELDELVQRVRIKFWQALERREIHHPCAYIQLIVRSECAEMARRQPLHVPLPSDEEQIHGERAFTDQDGSDPADEVEQREEVSARLQEVLQAVLALPPQQRLAMICTLRDRVDDLAQLIEALKASRVDVEAIRWPTDKAKKQVLQASVAAARKSIAKQMKR